MDCYDHRREYDPIIQRAPVQVPWVSHGKVAERAICIAVGFVLAVFAGIAMGRM